MLVVVPAQNPTERGVGSVAVLVRTDPATTPTAPLVRLVALYVAMVGAALLLFAYFAVTRLVVRPVDELSRGAARVASGGRSFDVTPGGGREFQELRESLATMTRAIRSEEEALRQKVAEVEAATAKLREAQASLVRSERLASVGRLSAGLAHEVGNPLASVQGLLELLADGGLSESEQKDFLARAKKETERIHLVVRGLLDFARPVRGEGASAEGSVSEAVGAVRSLIRGQRTLRDVEIVIELEPELPSVRVATGELEQIVLNLLLNAGDAIGGKGRVEVAARLAKGEVEITIDDDGPGIDPDVTEKLFEPFVTTKEVGKGTGLGLAVCRGIVEAAGGSIAAERSPLGGARFRLAIPVA
jgi:signal transduction histidine kinase